MRLDIEYGIDLWSPCTSVLSEFNYMYIPLLPEQTTTYMALSPLYWGSLSAVLDVKANFPSTVF